jgi:uroporphyrinogen-III synthase
MRVLVTRPQRQGERTAHQLRSMGHEPLLLPLSEPRHDTDAAIEALNVHHGPIAITSAEAVRSLTARSGELARHLTRPLFCVGAASAEAADAAGFTSVSASTGDGSDLAALIAGQANGVITYLAGVPRAETFEKRAAELELQIDVAVCYRMQPVTIDLAQIEQLARTPADAVLFYSREAALAFFELFAAESTPFWLTDAKLLCLSEAVATAIPGGLRKNIRTAAMPDEQSLLSLL